MTCLLNNYELNGESVLITFTKECDIEKHSHILIKKRKSNIEHMFQIQSDKFKGAFIDCRIFNTGIWDIYLLSTSNETSRLQISKDVYSDNAIIYYSDEKSYNINLYQTKNGNASIKVTPFALPVDLHKVKRYHDNITLSLRLHSKNIIEKYDENSSSIVLEPMHMINNKIEVPANIEKLNEYYLVHFTLTNKMKENLLNIYLGKWKIDFQFSINQSYRKVKLEIIDDSLPDKTNDLLEFEELIESCFYRTKGNFLGFEYKKVTQVRNIESFEFVEDKIIIVGQSGLNIIQKKIDLKTSFLLRDRYTGDILELIDHINITENSFNSFKITIHLSKLYYKIQNAFNIFDIFVQVHYKSYTFQKKLRFNKFTYYKDYYEKNKFFKNKNNVMLFSQAISPFGNIKLLVYKLSKKNAFKLKYNKQISKTFFKNKNVWLIGERFDTAQDNGYHFFKYCRENHPDLPIYYVIDTSSNDFERVKHLGNVVDYGSNQHFNLLLKTKVFIGTHDFENILPIPGQFLTSFQQGIRIFLQHGVLGRKIVEYNKQFYKYPFHMFCVSSIKEKELVTSVFEYDDDDVKITGLSRFDALNNTTTKKSILLMPTWREWLTDEKTFIESEYYKRYHALINHPELQTLLEENNVHLEFYPHYRMQPYIQHFKDNNLKNISVIQLGEATVQELIQRNHLMITDYSSVSFDFTYLNKPVLYYHFDFDTFFRNGILRDKNETFLGEISSTEDELLNQISDLINRGFVDKSNFSDRRTSLFYYNDRLNNKRIYNEIQSILLKNIPK